MKKRNRMIGSTLAMLMIGTAVMAQTSITRASVIDSSTKVKMATNTEVKTVAKKDKVEITNSYDNTKALSKKFPVVNPTPIQAGIGEKIQNRLLTGFENWNRGYDAWAEWGNILYTKDSYYNVHGVRLSLEEYQAAMDLSLKATDIQMGKFNNMIICGDWAAIRYDITNTDRKTNKPNDATVMEFVKFKDYGEDLGVRVVEGWAGTKGADYKAMTSMQTEEERAKQQEAQEKLVNATLPYTNDLKVKYPVKYATPIETKQAKIIESAILEDFDKWNQGYGTWSKWADSFYDTNLQYNVGDSILTLPQYKDSVKKDASAKDTKRMSFDNMLISGDWAAIHYRVVNTDQVTGEKTAQDVMQFLHFKIQGDHAKVIECWTK